MKPILVLLGALTAAGTAQDISQLPPCGQTCVNNMLGKASDLGCQPNDVACLCKNVDFGYGIRDCSYQVCPNGDDAAKVVSYGVAVCSGAGVVVTTGTVDTATVGVPTGSAPATAPGGAGGSGGAASPVATSTVATVVVSGSSTFTISVVTTISGISGVAGATSVPVTAISTIPIVTTIVSGTDTTVSTIGSSTIFSTLTGSAASSALSSQASEASSRRATTSGGAGGAGGAGSPSGASATSTTSSALAAHKTAAPAGLLAAAGLAAMLL